MDSYYGGIETAGILPTKSLRLKFEQNLQYFAVEDPNNCHEIKFLWTKTNSLFFLD